MMEKFILIMKLCSAAFNDCAPEYKAGLHNSWYECAAQGTMMTASALSELGPEMVNKNKIYVSFKCQPLNNV